MFILDGQPLAPGVPFTHGGIQYPANFLALSTQKERLAIGITEVPDPPVWDQRFYWGYDDKGNLIPKDHGQLVDQWVNQTRTTANTLLAPTDWIIIREADNGKPADPVLKTWREDIRIATGVKLTAIRDTTDTEELAAYITSANYPEWPRDPYGPAPVELSADDGLESAGDGEEG